MRTLALCVSFVMLSACGPSEEQIRADERAKMLEQRVAELEDEAKDAGEAKGQPGNSASFGEPASAPSQPTDSAKQGSSMVRESQNTSEQLIAAYNAYLGDADLYNSTGDRLTKPWQILRQDRANFHRFGVSQAGDQGDPFFRSGTNRSIMERMVGNGTIESGAARQIVKGNVRIRVEIYGKGSVGQRVEVTVL